MKMYSGKYTSRNLLETINKRTSLLGYIARHNDFIKEYYRRQDYRKEMKRKIKTDDLRRNNKGSFGY